jgi:hypothetical protein
MFNSWYSFASSFDCYGGFGSSWKALLGARKRVICEDSFGMQGVWATA